MTVQILVTKDIATCHALRRTVFTEEQGVSAADEQDGLDDQCIHLLALQDGVPVGTARLMPIGDIGKVGRVCVLQQARGTGLGFALMRAAVDQFRTMPGIKHVKLGAQTHALAFYERLGFTPYGDIFLDAGIPHRNMELEL
jgi:predicted GNAT family N-acyltransferase